MTLSLDLLASPYPWALAFLLLMVVELSTSGFVAGFIAFGALLTAFAAQVELVNTPGSVVFAFFFAFF